ncbi:hypothetical protein BDV27DRAFT_127485 [Aspergillus caelatus]|uniref:Uncharacterized protein n=1 Tax=Aspergillus caelatus TaxID=61420 RepID=A0A5N7A5R2_9EURO|nr:uncharacterized protein BDV27DRAFT_127485 [Aspergillus caelatus]KAE8365055.1 hypothetical protein BDV27DRAFT_127485 [Aspergillus caelatus]
MQCLFIPQHHELYMFCCYRTLFLLFFLMWTSGKSFDTRINWIRQSLSLRAVVHRISTLKLHIVTNLPLISRR